MSPPLREVPASIAKKHAAELPTIRAPHCSLIIVPVKIVLAGSIDETFVDQGTNLESTCNRSNGGMIYGCCRENLDSGTTMSFPVGNWFDVVCAVVG